MTNRRFLSCGAALIGSALLTLVPTLDDASAPTPGPGGVLDAVEGFLEATARGDFKRVAAGLSDHQAYGGAPGFHDTSSDGQTIDAQSARAYAAALERRHQQRDGQAISVDVKRIVADCPSGNCSYAYVEFDRISGVGDDAERTPMRATALLAHSREAPHFLIYHWNAAVATSAVRRQGSK